MKLHWFAPYQIDRIQYYLGRLGHISGFSTEVIRENGRYDVVQFLSASYGVIAAVVVGCYGADSGHERAACGKETEKNQLGMMIGYAGALFFLFMTLFHIGGSCGFFPGTTSFLPFLSSGGLKPSGILCGSGTSAQRVPLSEPASCRAKENRCSQKNRRLLQIMNKSGLFFYMLVRDW